MPTFFSATFENWQSEWLQLVFQAILLMGAKHLIFKVDAADLERIESKLDQVHAAVEARTPDARGDSGTRGGPTPPTED